MDAIAGQKLAIVERSPALVAAHDKSAWLALFSADACAEDPVGTTPNRVGAHPDARSGDDLSRFYDTFIAGNAIRFEVLSDYVAGDEVARDVVIHTRLSTGLDVVVPAHLLYQVVDEGGGLRIRRMRACWDLRRRSIDTMLSGWRGLYTLVAISLLMFRVQGVRGLVGYSRGLLVGVFGRGKVVVERLAASIASGDEAGLARLFVPAAPSPIELPVGVEMTAASFLSSVRAGYGDDATLRAEQITSAGWLTSFRFTLRGASGARSGLAFVEHDPATRRIASLRFFTPEVGAAQSTNGTSAIRSGG